jgi:hypothetical protein
MTEILKKKERKMCLLFLFLALLSAVSGAITPLPGGGSALCLLKYRPSLNCSFALTTK